MGRDQFLSDDQISRIADIGAELLNENPNARFISIGQSPSYYVLAAQMTANHRGQSCEASFVPLSGAMLFNLGQYEGKANFAISKHTLPTYEGFLCFQETLKRQGADADSIIKAYEETGKKTVVTDLINSGSGLATYLYMLIYDATETDPNGAKLDRLKKALSVTAFTKGSHRTDLPFEFNRSNVVIPVKTKILPDLPSLAILEGDERLVPSHEPKYWENAYPEQHNMGGGAAESVIHRLLKEVKRRPTVEDNSPMRPEDRRISANPRNDI